MVVSNNILKEDAGGGLSSRVEEVFISLKYPFLNFKWCSKIRKFCGGAILELPFSKHLLSTMVGATGFAETQSFGLLS